MRCEIWAQPAVRALCLEYRVSWVRVPPEAAHFFLGKVTALGVLCCFALFVCLTMKKHVYSLILQAFSVYAYTRKHTAGSRDYV